MPDAMEPDTASSVFLWEFTLERPVEGDTCVVLDASSIGPDHAVVHGGPTVPSGRRGESAPARWVGLSVRGGSVVFHGCLDGPFEVVMEDTRLHGRHRLDVLGDDRGTAFYLDGYVVWSTRRPLVELARRASFRRGQAISGRAVTPEGVEGLVPYTEDAELFLRDRAPVPQPLVAFVTPEIDGEDARDLGDRDGYGLHARFRVRGPGQYGTVLAAGLQGEPVLNVRIDADGMRVERQGSPALEARGAWSDGRWHHVVVSFDGGAAQLWVDGWLQDHDAGRAPRFDRLTIGQDLRGERLMGEVGSGGVHDVLNDQQIARLARRAPIVQVPVFDRWPTGAFHRIPAVARLRDGSLVAVADARHGLPNDAPNVTDLVVARSETEGRTWSEPDVLLGFRGRADAPISVTDAALVEDSIGRIHVLADLYPGGLGLLAARPGAGVNAGVKVRVTPTGQLLTADGVDLGSLRERGTPATEVGHIVHLWSEDGGVTWSVPRLITASVKDEWMPFLGIGPGAGLRLNDARWAGRLIVPCYFSDEAVAQFSAAVLISDDDGATWRRSSSTNAARTVDGRRLDERHLGDPTALMSEASVVELGSSGDLVLFARSQRARVTRAVSHDGGETWGGVCEDDLREIFCQPAAAARGDVVYFANASRMLPYRGCGAVRRATDGASLLAAGAGTPWQWQELAVNPRHHGYQSLVTRDDGVGMLWERETAGVWYSVVTDALF